MMLALCYGLAVLCLVATLLPLSRHEAWWVRAADFPRLQIALLILATIVGLWLLGAWNQTAGKVIVLMLLLALVYQAAAILPYAPFWSVELQAGRAKPGNEALRLMVVNVLMDNRKAERLVAMIDRYQPDLLLAVETDQWWCEQLERVTADYAFKLSRPLDNTYGMYFCSRLELLQPEFRYLIKPDIPSIRTGVRLRSGQTVSFYALHPEPPAPSEAETALPRDAELITVAREIATRDRAAIVAGDLNDVAWSHTSRMFRRISRMLDPRIGRGLFATFHADYLLCRWPLDHVFASDDFVLQEIRRLYWFGSDHFPILVTLSLAPREAASQEGPEPVEEDLVDAEDKLERIQAETGRAPAGTVPAT
jgi:endonuclease/exonuclease/phosphatase (EEP) superfamily protein YafD